MLGTTSKDGRVFIRRITEVSVAACACAFGFCTSWGDERRNSVVTMARTGQHMLVGCESSLIVYLIITNSQPTEQPGTSMRQELPAVQPSKQAMLTYPVLILLSHPLDCVNARPKRSNVHDVFLGKKELAEICSVSIAARPAALEDTTTACPHTHGTTRASACSLHVLSRLKKQA